MMSNNAIIVTGSVSAIAKRDNIGLAEAFMGVDCVVLVDTSGSMCATDARGGRSRYEVACDELAALQAQMPGKIAVISFSDTAVFCPGGVPEFLQQTTNLKGALVFAQPYDVAGMRFVVISDGSPDDEQGAINVAATFTGRIDTIYVGPEGGAGAEFLRRLAAAHAGQSVKAAQAAQLASKMQLLLSAG